MCYFLTQSKDWVILNLCVWYLSIKIWTCVFQFWSQPLSSSLLTPTTLHLTPNHAFIVVVREDKYVTHHHMHASPPNPIMYLHVIIITSDTTTINQNPKSQRFQTILFSSRPNLFTFVAMGFSKKWKIEKNGVVCKETRYEHEKWHCIFKSEHEKRKEHEKRPKNHMQKVQKQNCELLCNFNKEPNWNFG